MVGVINPHNDSQLDDFRNRAKNASYVLQPGDPWPSEADIPGRQPQSPSPPSTTTSTSSAPPPPTTVTALPTPTRTNDNGGGGGLSSGGVAGVSLGAAAVVALIGALFFFLGRRRTDAAHSVAGNSVLGYPPMRAGPMPAGFRGSGDPAAYGLGGAYGPDPSAFPPRSVGTASPLGDEGKQYGWRSSRQSTLRNGRPVEMGAEGDAATVRDTWGFPALDSAGSPLYPPPPPQQQQQPQQQPHPQPHPQPNGIPPAMYHPQGLPSGPPSTNNDPAPPTNGAAVAGSAVDPGRYGGRGPGPEQH